MSSESKQTPPTELVPQKAAIEESTQQPPGEPTQAWAFEQLIKLERERVASNNRRLDVAEKVIGAGEAADKRQHEYHVERLRQGSKDRNARHWSFMKLVWAAAIVTATFGGISFYMLFFGDEAQRALALDLLTVVGTAVGGGGALYAFAAAVRQILESNAPEED